MIADDIAVLLTRELDGFSRGIALFPDDETLWRTVPGVPNAAGNLALHVAGNIRYFVGTVIGHTGYLRDRDAEFSRRTGTRDEVLAELADARRVVHDVLRRFSDADLEPPMPHLPLDGAVPLRRFLMHLAVHAGYHLGQADYVRRIVTGDGRAAGALGLPVLAEPRQGA